MKEIFKQFQKSSVMGVCIIRSSNWKIFLGIKDHTIRIWEKRYQLIVPGRANDFGKQVLLVSCRACETIRS